VGWGGSQQWRRGSWGQGGEGEIKLIRIDKRRRKKGLLSAGKKGNQAATEKGKPRKSSSSQKNIAQASIVQTHRVVSERKKREGCTWCGPHPANGKKVAAPLPYPRLKTKGGGDHRTEKLAAQVTRVKGTDNGRGQLKVQGGVRRTR